ncbi:MAG TPA: site-specific DNA-methyltransferase [Tepidisphaeraceae bacterium]
MNISEARQIAYQNGFRTEADAKARPWTLKQGGLPINQVVRGDSIELLNAMQPGWVDLVFADPPFNIGYLYHNYDDRRSVKEYLDFSRNWMAAVYRALKPNGSFYLAIGDEFAADLAVIARRELGFHMRNWIVWHYTFGQQTKKKFAKSHTHILYFSKEKPEAGLTNLTFNADEIRVKSARQTVYADTRANSKGKLPDDTWFLRPQEATYFEQGFKNVPMPDGLPSAEVPFFDPTSSTWNISRVCGTFKEREGWHGCQMPIAVLDRIIKASSNEGDIVLDPFNGSGTTCVSAALLGRRFVGFDQSEEYVGFARKRLEHALDVKDGNGDVHDKKRASKKETPTDAFGRARVKRKPRAAAVVK